MSDSTRVRQTIDLIAAQCLIEDGTKQYKSPDDNEMYCNNRQTLHCPFMALYENSDFNNGQTNHACSYLKRSEI